MKKEVSGYKLIFGYLGLFMTMIGIIILLPLLALPFYPEEADQYLCFVIPSGVTIIIGFLLYLYIFRKEKGRLEKHQDSILVVLIWVVCIIASALPYIMSGNYSFVDAVFESTSGYSTTGLTITNVEAAPHIFLLYRAITQFIGGVGLVLILTSAVSERHGLMLYNSEGHTDKLLPNLAKSARAILSIYIAYIILGSVAYIIFGMNPFDAICHSICALATGGFSTKAASIGYYNSLPIEIITCCLMIFGATNFVVHLLLLRRKFKKLYYHTENRFTFFFVIISVIIMTFIIFNNVNGYESFIDSLRVSLFHFISVFTTTGYQTVPTFNVFPVAFLLMLIIGMLFGGQSGSTSGAIKDIRIVTVSKGLFGKLNDKLLNKNVYSKHFIWRFGKKEEIGDKDLLDASLFILVYFVAVFIGTFLITLSGYSLIDSFFEFVSSVGGVGLSLGVTATANAFVKWILIVGMFLGRLEILVVIEAIAKGIKDIAKNHKLKKIKRNA